MLIRIGYFLCVGMQEVIQLLTDKQIEAIELYVKGTTPTEIAKICGVNRTTFYDWLKKDEFKLELDKQQQEIKNRATSRISSKVDTYIGELERIALTSKSDKTRTDALTYLIDHVVGKSTTKFENINQQHDNKQDNKELSWDNVKEDESIKLKVVKKQYHIVFIQSISYNNTKKLFINVYLELQKYIYKHLFTKVLDYLSLIHI